MQPEVGGVMRFSRGVAYLNPQGPSPTGQGSAEAGAQEADLVAQAFSALQARKEGAANGLVRQHSRLEGLQTVFICLLHGGLCVCRAGDPVYLLSMPCLSLGTFV